MVPGRLPSRLPRHTPFVTALALLISTLIPGDASAQYFGGNKVQYRTFDFQVLRRIISTSTSTRRSARGLTSPRGWPSGGAPVSDGF